MKTIFLNKMVSTGDNWFYLVGDGDSINSTYLDGFVYKHYLNSEYISQKIYHCINGKETRRFLILNEKGYHYED